MVPIINDVTRFIKDCVNNGNKSCVMDLNDVVIDGIISPFSYIAWKVRDCNILSIRPGEVIISKVLIDDIFNHPHVKLYHEWFLRVWRVPNVDVLWLMPCTAKKPYIESVTYRMVLYYVKSLRELGISVEVIAISEPMGLVPIKFCRYYPLANYDYPPKLMDDKDRELMVKLIARLIKKILGRPKLVIATLPRHHRSILEDALSLLGVNDCIKIIPYGKLAFRSLRRAYEYVINVMNNGEKDSVSLKAHHKSVSSP